jgi:hypothetical protein
MRFTDYKPAHTNCTILRHHKKAATSHFEHKTETKADSTQKFFRNVCLLRVSREVMDVLAREQ